MNPKYISFTLGVLTGVLLTLLVAYIALRSDGVAEICFQ